MWECPKCGRIFKKTNQDHYCGPAPATIEEDVYKRQVNKDLKEEDEDEELS